MANQRMPQPWFLNLAKLVSTLAVLILCLTFASYVFYFQAPFGPAVDVCFKTSVTKGRPVFGPAIITSIGIAGLLIGILYDIKMYHFLKQRKKLVQPGIAMIAWKQEVPAMSIGPNASLKATVPIKATCLGALNLMVFLPILYILINEFQLGPYLPYIMKITALIIATVHMPLILLLTSS